MLISGAPLYPSLSFQFDEFDVGKASPDEQREVLKDASTARNQRKDCQYSNLLCCVAAATLLYHLLRHVELVLRRPHAIQGPLEQIDAV